MTFKTTLVATAAATLLATAAFGDAQSTENPMVGGAEMLADQPIAVTASNAPNLTTLVAAVTQAELVDVLASEGPFTVFAPTNDAFAGVPADTGAFLMQHENRAAFQGILTYHVVHGAITTADLMEAVATQEYANHTTVAGGTITAQMRGTWFDHLRSNGPVFDSRDSGRDAIKRRGPCDRPVLLPSR